MTKIIVNIDGVSAESVSIEINRDLESKEHRALVDFIHEGVISSTALWAKNQKEGIKMDHREYKTLFRKHLIRSSP